MILSRTKILNIFTGSIQASSAIKVLISYCNRYTYEYIPHRGLWINRLYFDISNSSKKQYLTVDTRNVNDLGPARFRIQADSNKEQIYYYNRNEKENNFNCFSDLRKQASTADKILFYIVNLIDTRKKRRIFDLNLTAN